MTNTVEISPYVSGLLEVGMALVLSEVQQPRQSEENGDNAAFDAQRIVAGHLCELVSGGESVLTVRDPLDLGLLLSAIEAVLKVLPYTRGCDKLKKFRATLLGIDDA